MKFILQFPLCSLVVFGLVAVGCSSSKKDESNGAGTFPNFYEKTKQAVPNLKLTSNLTVADDKPLFLSKIVPFFATGSFPTSSAASVTAADFTTAFDVKQNFIGQVLNDAGITGSVKSMYVLLAQVQGTLDGINSTLSDKDGAPANCTAIAAGVTPKVPFFKTAATAPFNEFSDVGKYTCYTAENDGILAFGRHAITAPPAACTDAYEYYVLQGYGKNDVPNSEQVSERGDKTDIGSVNRFYYNGCTSELKMMYAQSTKYSAGVEFSSRTELTGNVADHSFSIRVNFIDASPTYATHFTTVGTGVSKVKSGQTTPVNFLMGYRTDNCGTSTNSATCTEGTAKSFCVKNSGSTSDYALNTTVTECASLDTAYSAISPFARSDLPGGYFEVSASAIGF